MRKIETTTYLIICAGLLSACSHRRPYDKVRVTILRVESAGGATIGTGEAEKPILDTQGVMASLESRLLQNNVTVVDDAEVKAVVGRILQAKESGIHTTATTVQEYQPAATHGIFIKIQEHIGLLTALSLGIVPRSVDITARMVDLRSGEVRASAQGSAWGSIFSSRAAYKAARRLADRIAETLAQVQEQGRHLRPKDWPTDFQIDSSDPSAQGRYTRAVYLSMMGFYDQSLEALREAVRLDGSYAARAREAWEFEPLRDDQRFRAVVKRE